MLAVVVYQTATASILFYIRKYVLLIRMVWYTYSYTVLFFLGRHIVKTLLSFFGQIFFALLVILGVGLLLFYLDLTDAPGILPAVTHGIEAAFAQATLSLEDLNLPDLTNPDPGDIEITVAGQGKIEKTNLLPTQPLPIVATREMRALELPTLAPTRTPAPPLDPVVYETEATIRLKAYAAALERWLASNDQLMRDNTLLQDAAWRAQVKDNLSQVVTEGRRLGAIGRPPEAYAEIDTWLKRAGAEAELLQASYLQALDSADARDFTAAGDSFTRIKKYLTQAAQAMLLAGWNFGS